MQSVKSSFCESYTLNPTLLLLEQMFEYHRSYLSYQCFNNTIEFIKSLIILSNTQKLIVIEMFTIFRVLSVEESARYLVGHNIPSNHIHVDVYTVYTYVSSRVLSQQRLQGGGLRNCLKR